MPTDLLQEVQAAHFGEPEVEKDEVEVLPHQGATDQVKMRVAAIKIETGLTGAKNVTHVKVLIPGTASEQPATDPADNGGGGRFGRYYPGNGTVTLKEGQGGLFFLAKHPTVMYRMLVTMARRIRAANQQQA